MKDITISRSNEVRQEIMLTGQRFRVVLRIVNNSLDSLWVGRWVSDSNQGSRWDLAFEISDGDAWQFLFLMEASVGEARWATSKDASAEEES